MLEISETKLKAAVKTALAKAAGHKRWQNAINKAESRMLENPEFMDWQADTESLLIWSQESNEIYAANGVCSCRAYQAGFPCWHRAAARLVRNVIEAPASPSSQDILNAPYLKQTPVKKIEKVGSIRI